MDPKFFFGWAKNLIIASFWFFSNDTTVDAFDTFVCKNGAGNHILGAVFVDLETIVIYEIYRDLLAAFQSWVTYLWEQLRQWWEKILFFSSSYWLFKWWLEVI